MQLVRVSFKIGAPAGIWTRVAGMKTRNDGPNYTTGAAYFRVDAVS